MLEGYGGREILKRRSTSFLSVSFLLVLLIPHLAASSAFASEAALFEHTFKRAKGTPVTEQMMIALPASVGKYSVLVKNGLPDGSSRCSSAEIKINSTLVVSPSDLNQKITKVSKSVELSANNLLSVKLDGAPGSLVTVSVIAEAVVVVDNQSPIIFLAPLPEVTPGSAIEIKGRVEDLSATTVSIQGKSVNVPAGGGPFSVIADLEEGLNTLTVTATDASGNLTVLPVRIIFDSTFPVIAITSPLTDTYTNQAAIGVVGTISDATAVRVTVNGLEAVISSGTFTVDAVPLIEGLNQITAAATDAANLSGTSEITIISDTVPPVITIDPAPEYINQSSIELTGRVDDQTASIVTIQGKTAFIPAGGGTFSLTADLVEGMNDLTLTAIDSAGNSSTTTLPMASDTIMPVLKITAPSSNSYTDKNTIAVSGTIADATAARVIVNGVEASVSAGVFTVSGISLGEGTNTINATATDASGNTAFDEITIISDTIPPAISIDALPDISKQRSIELTGRVDDRTASTVTIQGKTAFIPAGGGTFSLTADLVEGMNDLTLTAIDSAGNFSSVTLPMASDTIMPVLKITAPLSNSYTDKNTIAVSGTIADATAARVIVNGVEAGVSAGFFTATGISLGEGTNTINATATDASANTASDEITIISDTVPPVISIEPIPGFTPDHTLEFKGRVDDRTASTVTIQGKTVLIPAGGGSYAIAIELTEGQNIISVSASDSAGNASGEQRTITLDTIAPEVKISSPAPGSYINKASVAVSGPVADATAARVLINGVDAVVADGGFTLSSLSLSEGSNTITATANDSAGNIGSDTVYVVSDTIAPTITIDPAPQYTNQSSIEIKGRVDDQTASMVTIQGTTVSIPAGGGPYAIAVILTGGINSIAIQATDSAGNTSGATRTVTLDAVAPMVKITSPAADTFIGAHNITVNGTLTESSSTKVVVNGVEVAVAGNSFTLQSLTLSEGSNAIKAEATDAAGNKGTDELSVISDTIAPVVTITKPADGLKTGNKLQTVSGAAVDASPIVSATLNDAPLSLGSTAFNQQITLQEGTHTITVRAMDKAGNIGTAIVTVTLDDMAPAAPVLDLLPVITNLLSITLAGYSEPKAKIRISNGTETTADAVGRFAVSVTLTADTTNTFSVRAVDALGNEGEAAVASIIQDSIEPYVTGHTLKADPKITLLIPISVTFSEQLDPATVNSDNITVGGTSGSVDGTFGISGNEVLFTPLSEFPANKTFILTIGPGIKDKAGNPLSPIYSSSFNTIRGPAFIVGEVYDDTTGLPLEGAMMKITRINDAVPEPMPSATSDAMGRFSLSYQGVSGVAQIVIEKAGFSKVLRESYLWPNQSMTIFDGRLTPVITHTISATSGGTLGAGDTALYLPAGALASNADISLTALSQQGIGQRLPIGWSPVYGVDIAPSLTALNPPAQLTIRNIWSLVAGGVVVAYLDEGSRSWTAASHVVSPDTITVTMDRLGQYLLILPDSLPAAPPMPAQPGDPILPASGIGIDSSMADVKVVPPAVLSREGAHGMTKVIMTTTTPVSSGTALEARFTEQYTLKEGQVITPETYTQDITMYGGYATPFPDQPNNQPITLSAEFPTTPSKIYPLGTLYYGKVGIDIFIPSNAGQPSDNVIGESGGTVSAPDGTAIIIPPSSVTSGTVFGVTRLLEQDLPVRGFPGLTFIGALNLQMDGGSFKAGVFPRFTVPGLSAPEGTRVILSRIESMNGQNGLKAVAIATVTSGKIELNRCLTGVGIPPLQCIYSGRYGFHIPSAPIGYLTGTIMKEGVAVAAALVWVDNLPYKALSEANGSFSMLSLAGSYAITAVELSTGQRVSETGTLAGEQTKNILLNLAPYHPAVLAVVPADKTASIDLKAQVKVTFSDAVDPLTLDANTFRLIQTPALISQPDIVIQGHISLSGKNNEAIFIPDAELKPNATYHVKLTDGIKDIFGNSLVPFESVFTTANVLGNEALPPGTLKASMPDAEGYVTVRGGVGLTYGKAVVVIINLTKNITVTVIADEDGSFMAKIRADLPDEIVVDVKDLLGNTTTLSTGLLQSDDGTAAVGPKGGTIYGPGGIKAVVPEGAFDETVVVKITMVPEETIKDVTIDPEMKSAGVFKIDMGGVTAKKELKISIPAPDWITPEHQILLTKVINIRGIDELTLSCPAILKDEGGERSRTIVSTSPPFVGVTGEGTYTLASWTDFQKGVGYALVQTWSPYESVFITGAFGLVFPALTTELVTFPITIPLNKTFAVDLSTLGGTTVKTVSIQGPPAKGDFLPGVIKLTNDPVPPTVFNNPMDGAQGVLLADNIIIEMSESVDAATVNCEPGCGTNCKPGCGNVVVKDSDGKIVEGTVYLAADGKTIVFVPKYGYNYATDYTIVINGVADLGGNLLSGYESTFTTFTPTVSDAAQGVSGAMALDRYRGSIDGKDYLVVTGAYTDSNGKLVEDSGLMVVDVSTPEKPVVRGVAHTFGHDRDLKAVPNLAFTDRNGNMITGDFAVVVGGQANAIGYLNFMNITDPMHPYIYENLYLSWNPMYTEDAPNNVPFAGGTPYRVEVLGTYAYVVNMGLGIQAVDLTKVTPLQTQAQREAIVGTITEYSYRGISKIEHGEAPSKSIILATKNHTLSIIDPSLNFISEVTDLVLPFDVTGVVAFPIDVDGDGNLGTFEDNDGDATTSQQETFDLAFVSTAQGVVIIDVTHPGSPCKMAIIPTEGLPGKIEVDRERRLAYVMLDGGIGVVSLQDLRPLSNCLPSAVMIDKNKDNIDDRIISIIADTSGSSLALSDDGSQAYIASPTAGVKAVDLGLEIAMVDESDQEIDEIRFGDGSITEKIYHTRVQSDLLIRSCSNKTLTGKIRVIDKDEKPILPPGSEYYPTEYALDFLLSGSKCSVRINDNGVMKEKFIVSNLTKDVMAERAVDLSNKAVLHGGIDNWIEIEIKRVEGSVPSPVKPAPIVDKKRIEATGVIVIGIDGLRQDVLYAPGEASYSDPTGCGGQSCYLPIMDETLPGLSQILIPKSTVKLKDVTAIFPSITFASWASIFTGKMPNETGILGNEFFARDLYNSKTISIPGMNSLPSGMVTLDADGGAFRPLVPMFFYSLAKSLPFALSYVMPADWWPFPGNNLGAKLNNSAPGAVLKAKPFWDEINKLVASLYSVSTDHNVRCDQTANECRTVSMFNQYAEGVDWWGTPSYKRSKALIEGLGNGSFSSALMDSMSADETEGFIKDYFEKPAPGGRRKKFPALLSIYLPGIDHYAHAEGMNGYKNYFMNIVDVKISQIVKALKDQGEFDNKIFIITADHGHTAMPTDLTYIDTDWLGRTVTKPAEMSCELKTDFVDVKNPSAVTREQLAELNNNSLHIWELGEMFKAIGQAGGTQYKVLAPQSIADLYKTGPVGATADIKLANVIAGLNGPMAHIYLKGPGGWTDENPDIVQLSNLAKYIKVFLKDGGVLITKENVKLQFSKLLSSVDRILIRIGGVYKEFKGVKLDANDNVIGPDAVSINDSSFAADQYIKAQSRIEGMNNVKRSGDIVLIMKDAMTGTVAERYTTAYGCKSWHGSLNPSDSYVPFIVAYPGGNKTELEPLINNTPGCSTTNGCDGNWRVTDLIKTIIQKQYGSQ